MSRGQAETAALLNVKLCHIVPSLEEAQGGPSKSVRALCVALARCGNEVDLLTTHAEAPREGATEMIGSLRIRTFRRNWPERLCPSPGLASELRKTRADVVHHHAIWLRTLHYAHQASISLGAKLVISPRGMMTRWSWHHHRRRKQFARAWVHRNALESASGWHVTSGDEERELRELGFPQPCCQAANGVERPSTEEATQAAQYWISRCPEVADRRVALFYARFHSKKRVIELIDLWCETPRPGWLLLLVGIPDEFEAAALERYISRNGGGDRIRVFDGIGSPVPYPVASLLLLPSHSENFGMAIAEAMSHGVPAVVTDTTPWSELNARNIGWCVPWSDYASTLAIAMGEPTDTLQRRGAGAREWVLEKYSWEQTAKVLVGFYEQLKLERHASQR